MLISTMTIETGNAGAAPTGGAAPAPMKVGPPSPAAGSAHRKLPVRALIPIVLAIAFLIWWFEFRPAPFPTNVIAVSGRIEGDDSAIATKPGGRVLEITVREGDRVQRGQLIAAAAIIGFSSSPVNGYRTPAASGTPSAL